jgi:soluble lytic murein transglycosylase-like protein
VTRRLVVALIIGGYIALLVVCFLCSRAHAAAAPGGEERIEIPPTSYLYRFKLEREVSARFGSTAHVARVAGQVHIESHWKPDARSATAQGMAQFIPATAAWLQSVCPEIGAPDPWDPNWSVRAVVCYDQWLYARVAGATACDAWAFTLSGYNGGPGWVDRDKRRAAANGADPARWFDSVDRFSARGKAAFAENRVYVSRILRVLEPAYLGAGWAGRAVCT